MQILSSPFPVLIEQVKDRVWEYGPERSGPRIYNGEMRPKQEHQKKREQWWT